jgi:AraC-like DNA-binding protein
VLHGHPHAYITSPPGLTVHAAGQPTIYALFVTLLIDLYILSSTGNKNAGRILMIRFDEPFLRTFETVEIRTDDLDMDGRFARQLSVVNDLQSYRLRRPAAAQLTPETVLSKQSIRRIGSLQPCHNADQFGTDIRIIGAGQPHLYCVVAMLSGAMEIAAGPNGTAVADGTNGLVMHGLAGTQIVTSDQSARLALWIEAARLHRALTAWLDEVPRQSLAFAPGVDWTKGPGRSVLRLITHFVDELRDPEGLATDAVARETFTDLLLHTMLNRLDHNHAARIARPPSSCIPGYLRRAEAFMHEAADRPITLADVSAAAGCSLGTLQTVFRRYRETTPLAALHDVRLQHVRQALLASRDDEPTRAIARRFGFSNPSRFIAAYGKRFGEHPTETRRRRTS